MTATLYVLDTDVLSLSAPTKAQPNTNLLHWLTHNGHVCFVSAISLSELSYGIARLRRRGAVRRAAALQSWLTGLMMLFDDRILNVDGKTAVRAGELIAHAEASGVSVEIEDALIASTADICGMIVLTGNIRHFRPMGVAFANPFEVLPPGIT